MRATFAGWAPTLALVAIAVVVAAVDCPCGYGINATDLGTSSPPVFTEAIETDFLHIANLSTEAAGQQWIPQAFHASPEASNGPYGRLAELQNVVPNPARSIYDWDGPGVLATDPGLQLVVRSGLVAMGDGSDGLLVPMAEIVSRRTDILYGSFRVGMKTTAVNGTCGAFFFYFNNSEEIDTEILSKQQTSSTSGWANLVVQSPESAAVGYVNNSLDFDQQRLAVAPQAQYNEFRFDWLPDRVTFYVNSAPLATITAHVPSVPGALHLNHWSNGNAGWSAGPPLQDAVLTLSYVKAYFNSSVAATTAAALAHCPAQQGPVVCPVPDQLVPPDPSAADGNVTGRTFFFNDTAVQVSSSSAAAAATSSGGGSSSTSTSKPVKGFASSTLTAPRWRCWEWGVWTISLVFICNAL